MSLYIYILTSGIMPDFVRVGYEVASDTDFFLEAIGFLELEMICKPFFTIKKYIFFLWYIPIVTVKKISIKLHFKLKTKNIFSNDNYINHAKYKKKKLYIFSFLGG